MALPSSWSGKSWTLTRSGVPAGAYSRPLFLNAPTSSFFLASTLTTGWPASACSVTWAARQRNWASRSACWLPSVTLALPCRLNPNDASIRATVRSETGCPTAVNTPARFRVDLVVHTNSDIGSPRVWGSTNAFNRASSPGSDSDSFFRPPPGPRTRACGSVPPASSRTPRATVSGCAPVASATVLIPPRPSSAASEPNMRRRCRSSRCGRSTAYLRPTDSATRTLSAIAQRYDPQSRKPRLFRRVSLGEPEEFTDLVPPGLRYLVPEGNSRHGHEQQTGQVHSSIHGDCRLHHDHRGRDHLGSRAISAQGREDHRRGNYPSEPRSARRQGRRRPVHRLRPGQCDRAARARRRPGQDLRAARCRPHGAQGQAQGQRCERRRNR